MVGYSRRSPAFRLQIGTPETDVSGGNGDDDPDDEHYGGEVLKGSELAFEKSGSEVRVGGVRSEGDEERVPVRR